jgi:hypothetical protein
VSATDAAASVALSSLQLTVRCHNWGDVCYTAQVCSAMFVKNAYIHRPEEPIFLLVYDKYKKKSNCSN